MMNHVKNEIQRKENIIKCYNSFLELAALKHDEEQLKNDELMSDLRIIADKNLKLKEKGMICEEDIRHEEKARKLVEDSLSIMRCYSDMLKDLEKSLNRKLRD